MEETYPKEYFVEIENEPYRKGRVTLNKYNDGYAVEVDIVQKEGMKIWHHVKRVYHLEDEQEALDHGVWLLSQFLRGQNVD